MRHGKHWLALLILLGNIHVGHTQSSMDDESKQRLAEQKLKLLEMLVNSPAAEATSVGLEAETPTLFERSRELIRQARTSIAGQRYDEALRVLDEALRTVAKANNRHSGELGLADSAQKKQFADFTEQLAVYHPALTEMSKDPRIGDAAKKLQARLLALTDKARQLAAAGRLGDANKKMLEAYKLAVEEISHLRAGHEVVLSLSFDSPMEEFIYEQKRFQSNEILISMMIGEGRANANNRQLLDEFLKKAFALKELAGEFAHRNDHKSAVSQMEQANGQLNHALQALGVPVF